MKTRRHFLWIIFLFVALLWLVWPSTDKAGRDENPQAGLGEKKHHPGDEAAETGPGMLSPRLRSEKGSEDLTGVDLILANDGINHQQAALQLREIAMNPMNSVEDRLEALQHGLNLHMDSFADFAKEKDLPSELASHLLHEMINHDDSPGMQIRCYMALMDHPDGEVSGLAKDMLALEVGDEEQLSTREKLLVAGQSKLALLASESGK